MRQPEPSARRGPRRGGVRALLAAITSAILIGATFGPIVIAAPGHRTSAAQALRVRPAAQRPVSVRHVASARAAAASAERRLPATTMRSLPLRSFRPDTAMSPHPASGSSSGPTTVDATAAVTSGLTAEPHIAAVPDLAAPTSFAGLDEAAAGGFIPPDPWVAVSSTYVVQAVNVVFRVSNRSGAEIASIPAWSLFALPAAQFPSDQRILWDAFHGRWVAISISFNKPFTDNYLNLAVSDGADPTAGWTTWSISYGGFFPDFPSVASSTDKIVLTDNLYDDVGSYFAADFRTVMWSSVLGGVSVQATECLIGGLFSPRAAQVLSPSADVHVVSEASEDGITLTSFYFRLKGTGACDETSFVDPTFFTGTFEPPPDPRQPGGDPIGDSGAGKPAIDERPTDAIWQNGKLYWVNTIALSYDGGATQNDAVAIWSATTSATGPAVEGPSLTISAGDGIDDFSGGIGLSRNGTLVTVYSQSSDADFVSIEANAVPPGGALGVPLHVEDGDATYPEDRWGDFAGVAMDPVGTGSVWATHEVSANDGTWRTKVVRLVVDTDTPTAPGVPTAALGIASTLGRSVPVRVTWPAATDGMTNVARYEVGESVDGSDFGPIVSIAATSILRSQLIGHTYQYEVRAVDAIGTVGPWRLSPLLRPYLYQQTTNTVYSTGWGSSTSSSFSGGSARYSTTAGKSATFTATAARSIAIVATKATTRGSFKVYVDGVYKATVSTYSTTTRYRQLVYQFAWSVPGTHKVKVVISGTSGHPRVDLDAFVVLR